MAHILYLAGPGVVISTALVATFVKFAFVPYGWSWPVALTFGSMMSATDPVAVVALLADLGAPKTLSILIEGMNIVIIFIILTRFLTYFDFYIYMVVGYTIRRVAVQRWDCVCLFYSLQETYER